MVKFIGLFLMFISAYCLGESGLDLGLVQAFFIGLFIFFSEALIGHVLFVQREKERARYRRH